MPSKEFHTILEKMKEIHDRKSHDYSKDSDPFSNFKFSAELVKHFNNPIDQVFAGIIGIKLARLSELLNGKEALNESADDTFVDLANYSALWGAYYKSLEVEKRKELIQLIKDKMDDAINNPIYDITKSECYPEYCSYCNTSSDRVKHAIQMHNAILNEAEQYLIYPDRTTVRF